MPVIARPFPILKGREKEAKEFAAQATGEQNIHTKEFYNSLGVTRESWHLQPTPDGYMMIVWTEFNDNKTFGLFSTLNTPYAIAVLILMFRLKRSFEFFLDYQLHQELPDQVCQLIVGDPDKHSY